MDAFGNYGAVTAGTAEEGALLSTGCVEAPRWRSVLPLLSYESAGDRGGGRRLAARRTPLFAGTAVSLLLRSVAAGNHLLFFKTTGVAATVIFLGLSCSGPH